ncbi:MAG: sugar ABC transporter substrate-binding protein [Blautia sp.]|nr:sugar ABC transporter substrate-binding protein [Blautia sp.]
MKNLMAGILAAAMLTGAGQMVMAEDTIKVGMVTFDSGADAYQSAYYDTMLSHAKELGVEIQLLDPAGDATKQQNMVQDLIGMACDVIIIWPANSETAIAEVKACSEAGIPVVAANTDVAEEGQEYVTCFVGPSNRLEGQNAGEAMVEEIGTDAKIVEISNMAGYTASIERMGGMHDAIEDTDIEILDSQPGEANREKAQQVMENYLVKYAPGEIAAVFCYDDTTAYGALNALEADGRDDVLVFAAAAGNYETINYVKNGKIRAISMQSPIIDATTTLDVAVNVAKGEAPAEYLNFIETPAVSQSNIDEIELEAW